MGEESVGWIPSIGGRSMFDAEGDEVELEGGSPSISGGGEVSDEMVDARLACCFDMVRWGVRWAISASGTEGDRLWDDDVASFLLNIFPNIFRLLPLGVGVADGFGAFMAVVSTLTVGVRRELWFEFEFEPEEMET